jgi:signal transduction histidine kinase
MGTARYVLDESFRVVEGVDVDRMGLVCHRALEGVAAPCADIRNEERRLLESQLAHQEKMAAFGLFAAGVAHEIGNPLAAISSELELLLGEQDLPTVQNSLSQIREQVGRISRILRELVDFARRRRDTEADLSLNSVISDTLRLIRPDPRMRSVVLSTELDPDIPAVRLVEDRLVQVLLNLVLNALDAMPSGGKLAIRTRPLGDAILLEVADSGVGMSEEIRARAFEPLFTTKPQGKGTGLGLSICADFVAAVGGRIEVESRPGEGATFRVTLPARANEEA